jgi:hypothetical protein
MTSLAHEMEEWRRWSSTAVREADGWESHYPDWDRLIQAATDVMRDASATPADWALLEEAWRMSEEDEDLKEIAEADLDLYAGALRKLARSKEPTVRWQVYVALGNASFGRDILRDAIARESDSYARRRAIGAYLDLATRDETAYGEVLGLLSAWLRDSDEYIRSTALTGIGELLSSAGSDPSWVVRNNLQAVAKRLHDAGASKRGDDETPAT